MGKTSFSGPVYGAKATLASIGPFDCSTGSSAVVSGVVVPAGEDWYITELSVYRGSTGSTNLVISLHDDSTIVTSAGVGGSSIAGGAVGIATADGGEYEGTRVATGSVLTVSHSSHAGPNVNVVATVRGFTRFINSSRSE